MSKRLAFTLIELLVVIAIIGILSGLIIVTMSGITQKANVAKSQIFSNSLRNALMLNMVGEWKFDGPTDDEFPATNNDVLETWSNANNGSIPASPAIPTVKTGLNCISGHCLSFDGGDYISHPTISFPDLVPYTYLVWVKWTAAVPSSYVIPFGEANNSNVYFTASDSKRFCYRAWNQNATIINNSNTASLFDKNWHNVAWTVDSLRNATFYIDGVKNGDSTVIATTSRIDYSRFGIGFSGGAYPWVGLIDEIRIYNAAIPTSQIKEQYYTSLNNLLRSGVIEKAEYQKRIKELNLSLK